MELLVSIGLFAVIMALAMGGFVRALRTQRQIVALISANSNLSLVLEQMSREIRTGFNFCSESACPEGTLTFMNARGKQITYAFNGTGNRGKITRTEDALPAADLTADNVDVRYLYFDLLAAPNYPPRITIRVGVSPIAAAGLNDIVSRIETTVSARTVSF